MNDMPKLVPLSRWLVEQPAGVVALRSGAAVGPKQLTSRVGAWMATLDRHPGNRWAVYHGDSFEFLAILLALWQLGRTACISSDKRPATVKRWALGVDGVCGEFPSTPNVVTAPEIKVESCDHWVVAESEFAALEIHTSGSSGDPKSIFKTIAQLEREIEALETLWPTEPDSLVLSTVSHQHFYGLTFALLWPFSSGRRFETRLCEFPEDIINRAANCSRFSLVSSPSHLSRFNPSLEWEAVAPCCDYVISSAAPLNREDSIVAGGLLDTQIREIYGSTETGAIAWRSQQSSDADALWRALPGVELESTGEGSLSIRSAFLGDVDHVVLPDRAEFDDQGGFRLIGRTDRIVKVEGKRVSLASIERLLLDHGWVEYVRALTIERRRIETAIVMQLGDEGWVQLHEFGRKPIIKVFKDILAEHLEAVVLPRRWRFVEAMPFNQQGKLPLVNLQSLFVKEALKLPHIMDRRLVDGQLILHCEIPPGLIYFDGHMLDQPVLPGIVQVHWAAFFARRMLAVTGRFERLEVIKFSQIVLPLYRVKISLSFNEATGKLKFRFESDRGGHSSGRICFKP